MLSHKCSISRSTPALHAHDTDKALETHGSITGYSVLAMALIDEGCKGCLPNVTHSPVKSLSSEGQLQSNDFVEPHSLKTAIIIEN